MGKRKMKFDMDTLRIAQCLFYEIAQNDIRYNRPTMISELKKTKTMCPDISDEEIYEILTNTHLSLSFMSSYSGVHNISTEKFQLNKSITQKEHYDS